MIEAAAYVSLTKHLQVKLVDSTICVALIYGPRYLGRIDFWSSTNPKAAPSSGRHHILLSSKERYSVPSSPHVQ